MTDRSIVDAAARLRRHGEPYVVATVVGVRGAAARAPGARLLLTRYRWVAGGVTGGCLEGDLAPTAWAATQGEAMLRTFDATARIEDEDVRAAFGLDADDGVEIDVLFERAGQPGRLDVLELAARCIRAQRRGAVATVLGGAGVRVGSRLAVLAAAPHEPAPLPEVERDALPPGVIAAILPELHAALTRGTSGRRTCTTEAGPIDVLVEAIVPPPRLFVFGTGHDAVPVVQLGKQLGWDVLVVAGEPRHATRERFACADEILRGGPPEIVARVEESERAVALLMHHDAARDRAALELLLPTQVRWVGVLGPAARARRLLADLGRVDDARVRAPGGDALIAASPQERALAIAAEVSALLRDAAAPATPPAPAIERVAEPAPAAERPPTRISAAIAAVAL